MVDENRLDVKFSITGRPDTAGLRIRSTNPIGLYISSRDAEAAQWYFEVTIINFIMARELLVPKPGGTLRLLEGRPDWNLFIRLGVGEVVICEMSLVETRKLLQVSTPVVLPEDQKLVTDWWKDFNEDEICMVHDSGDIVDEWLVRSINEDQELKKATIN